MVPEGTWIGIVGLAVATLLGVIGPVGKKYLDRRIDDGDKSRRAAAQRTVDLTAEVKRLEGLLWRAGIDPATGDRIRT